MYSKLEQFVETLDPSAITEDRRAVLDEVVDYLLKNENPQLNFICTHNSRRSQLSQVWAWALADFYQVNVQTFSGGTEVTAFHENAVNALVQSGFEVEKEGEKNPRFQVSLSSSHSLTCFSKVFDDETNPDSDFAAVMTCSNADEGCPFVPGAIKRIRLLYEDPKIADGTAEVEEVYFQRSKQIASEMKYIFGKVK